jgi:lysophospholipase L1-like esterase
MEHMPINIKTVIVFGDSLSDIGKKWVTKSGMAARFAKQMYVSPTGRFSDCRNWTDFMYEQASGKSLIVESADETYVGSKKHMTLTSNSIVDDERGGFGYANYAEGGACGDEPREKAPFLGTFKDQVDQFAQDLTGAGDLGNTLFIIWFGANDLYTANRPAPEMAQVAEEVGNTQRRRLLDLVRSKGPMHKFIFVNLARPLTSVRYTLRVERAERDVKTAVRSQLPSSVRSAFGEYNPDTQQGGYEPIGGWGEAARDHDLAQRELKALQAQEQEIRNLELGVITFNAALAKIAKANGDQVVDIGGCLTEANILALLKSNASLKAGAATKRAEHLSAKAYGKRAMSVHITTIDEVHPNDYMYRLIWEEIYEGIENSNCTFGSLKNKIRAPILSTLSGPQ